MFRDLLNSNRILWSLPHEVVRYCHLQTNTMKLEAESFQEWVFSFPCKLRNLENRCTLWACRYFGASNKQLWPSDQVWILQDSALLCLPNQKMAPSTAEGSICSGRTAFRFFTRLWHELVPGYRLSGFWRWNWSPRSIPKPYRMIVTPPKTNHVPWSFTLCKVIAELTPTLEGWDLGLLGYIYIWDIWWFYIDRFFSILVPAHYHMQLVSANDSLQLMWPFISVQPRFQLSPQITVKGLGLGALETQFKGLLTPFALKTFTT